MSTDGPTDAPTLPAVPADLERELETVAETLAQTSDNGDIARRLEVLIDTLIFRGQLPKTFRRVLAKAAGHRSSVRLALFRDKYAVPETDIDCAARIPLCGARCCGFEVTLSRQDVAEGKLPWDIDEPYVLPKLAATNLCACMDSAGACTVYEQRPGTCRAYDCRADPRVWIDFDARIPAPLDR